MDIKNYSVYIKNTSLEVSELEGLATDVIENIANDTLIFKTLFGFSIEPEIEFYDMRAMFGLDSRLNLHVKKIVSTSVNKQNVFDFFKTGKFPSAKDASVMELDEYDEVFLSLHGLVDVHGKSLMGHFTHMSGSVYKLNENSHFRDTTDLIPQEDRKAVGIAAFIPDKAMIAEDIERLIKPAIIAGIKFYVNDMYNDKEGAAVSDLYYKRFYAAKQTLINKYPFYNNNYEKDTKKQYA